MYDDDDEDVYLDLTMGELRFLQKLVGFSSSVLARDLVTKISDKIKENEPQKFIGLIDSSPGMIKFDADNCLLTPFWWKKTVKINPEWQEYFGGPRDDRVYGEITITNTVGTSLAQCREAMDKVHNYMSDWTDEQIEARLNE